MKLSYNKEMENLRKKLDAMDESDPEVRQKVFAWTRQMFTAINPRGYKELCVLTILKIGKASTTEVMSALPFGEHTTQNAINWLKEKHYIKPEGNRPKYWHLTLLGQKYLERRDKTLQNILCQPANLQVLLTTLKPDTKDKEKYAEQMSKIKKDQQRIRRELVNELLQDQDNPDGFDAHMRKQNLRVSKGRKFKKR